MQLFYDIIGIEFLSSGNQEANFIDLRPYKKRRLVKRETGKYQYQEFCQSFLKRDKISNCIKEAKYTI